MSVMGSHHTPPISIDDPSGSRELEAQHINTSDLHAFRVSSCEESRVTINILPDDVLHHIFLFDRDSYDSYLEEQRGYRTTLSWGWDRLVHVCQRWRYVVFGSPNILDLKLVCRPWTRVGSTDVWPPLPIVIMNVVDVSLPRDYEFGAATMYRARVCEMKLVRLTSSLLERLVSVMQEQFPALTHLFMSSTLFPSRSGNSILPEGFLAGSAPRLQSLRLRCIAFPTLPKLLLSATDLVDLELRNTPHSGYISPQAIITCLAVLVNLKSFTIGFVSPQSRPNRGSRPPQIPTRIVVPALTRFEFKGVSEWLEDLVARINVPLLNSILITLFHQLIFDIPELGHFMRRATSFQALDGVHLDFGYSSVRVGYLPPAARYFEDRTGLGISCRKFDWQLSSLVQVLTPFFPSIHIVEHLFIYEPLYLQDEWPEDIESPQWLEVFHPFTAVKSLYVCKEFAPSISLSLKELVEERVTDVLPVLNNVFLEEFKDSGPVHDAIGLFASARQLIGRPVAISQRNRARRF